jgi:hypothetical protein
VSERALAISIGDGQTIYAEPRADSADKLAELFGTSSTIELTATGDDLEGHAFAAGDVTVDVQGHALTLHVPNGSDAAALRRALAVGVVTATLVGAGAIASLQSPAHTQLAAPQAAPRVVIQGVPAQALHADQAATARENAFARAQSQAPGEAAAGGQVTVTAVQAPPQAIHADQATQAQEANQAAGNDQVPAQELNFDKAQSEREQH